MPDGSVSIVLALFAGSHRRASSLSLELVLCPFDFGLFKGSHVGLKPSIDSFIYPHCIRAKVLADSHRPIILGRDRTLGWVGLAQSHPANGAGP